MKTLALALSLVLVGCVSPDYQAWETAHSNFTYDYDATWPGRTYHDDEKDARVYTRIDHAFKGDCDDFAFTLQHQIGGEVWVLDMNQYGYHAVLVKDGWIYDNSRAIKFTTLLYRHVDNMHFNGELINN